MNRDPKQAMSDGSTRQEFHYKQAKHNMDETHGTRQTLLTWEREARFLSKWRVYDSAEYLRISKRGHDLLTGEDLARIVRTRSKSFRKSSNIQARARPIRLYGHIDLPGKAYMAI